jgi:hypothetical protein
MGSRRASQCMARLEDAAQTSRFAEPEMSGRLAVHAGRIYSDECQVNAMTQSVSLHSGLE